MTSPKPKSRKVAWVVLGVVVLALGLLGFLSCLYSASLQYTLRVSVTTDFLHHAMQLTALVP